MKLYEPHQTCVELNGKTYVLKPTFDRVVRFLELCEDPDLSAEDITEIAYSWLVKSPQNVDLSTKSAVIEKIKNEIISPPRRHILNGDAPKKCVDYNFDAADIYASFMLDYKIDLIEQIGKMHWSKFIALFDGLSADTPIKRIMHIRAEKIPQLNQNHSNIKQIQRLVELKALYALPEKQSPQEANKTWNTLFDTLYKQAGDENG